MKKQTLTTIDDQQEEILSIEEELKKLDAIESTLEYDPSDGLMLTTETIDSSHSSYLNPSLMSLPQIRAQIFKQTREIRKELKLLHARTRNIRFGLKEKKQEEEDLELELVEDKMESI